MKILPTTCLETEIDNETVDFAPTGNGGMEVAIKTYQPDHDRWRVIVAVIPAHEWSEFIASQVKT